MHQMFLCGPYPQCTCRIMCRLDMWNNYIKPGNDLFKGIKNLTCMCNMLYSTVACIYMYVVDQIKTFKLVEMDMKGLICKTVLGKYFDCTQFDKGSYCKEQQLQSMLFPEEYTCRLQHHIYKYDILFH